MATVGSLITSIISELHARTNAQEQACTLLTAVASDTVSLKVDDPNLGKGLIEIDSELVWVNTSAPDGTLTVPLWGRGTENTTAAAHGANTKVLRAPRFPRKHVLDAVNDSVLSLYPQLYSIATTDFQATWVTPQYELPAGARRVLQVEFQMQYTTDQEWVRVRRWKLDPAAPTDQFPSGVTLSLFDLPYTTTRVRVTYAGEPTLFSSEASDFSSCGLRASVADVVRCDVIARMVVGAEVARGQLSTVTQSQQAQIVTPGSTTSVARYFQTLKESKLRAEVSALHTFLPVRVVRTW